MRFQYIKPSFSLGISKKSKEAKKELNSKLNSMDKAILKKADRPRGEDIMGLTSACRPYTNKWGQKRFASPDAVRSGVKKLVDLGLLSIRE